MSVGTVTIGMAQLLVEGGRPAENLDRACRLVRRAADSRCAVAVLPECMDIGWTHPLARDLAEPIPGPRSDVLARVARETGLYVVAGLTECAGDAIYNAAVFLSPEGEVLHVHRKINELTIAHDLYDVGDRLAAVGTPFGRVGIDICADNFPDSLALAHSLARMGARMILSPSAWAVDADHDNAKNPYGGMWIGAYSAIARLYDVPVVGVSNVGWITGGPWKGRKCIGCSLAISRTGDVVAMGPYGDAAEDLIVVPLEVTEQTAKGTAVSPMLGEKGYRDPSVIRDEGKQRTATTTKPSGT